MAEVGPYLSERQWGTVREDYSEGGNAWDYFSYDQARSRAHRWGEDGLEAVLPRSVHQAAGSRESISSPVHQRPSRSKCR